MWCALVWASLLGTGRFALCEGSSFGPRFKPALWVVSGTGSGHPPLCLPEITPALGPCLTLRQFHDCASRRSSHSRVTGYALSGAESDIERREVKADYCIRSGWVGERSRYGWTA